MSSHCVVVLTEDCVLLGTICIPQEIYYTRVYINPVSMWLLLSQYNSHVDVYELDFGRLLVAKTVTLASAIARWCGSDFSNRIIEIHCSVDDVVGDIYVRTDTIVTKLDAFGRKRSFSFECNRPIKTVWVRRDKKGFVADTRRVTLVLDRQFETVGFIPNENHTIHYDAMTDTIHSLDDGPILSILNLDGSTRARLLVLRHPGQDGLVTDRFSDGELRFFAVDYDNCEIEMLCPTPLSRRPALSPIAFSS